MTAELAITPESNIDEAEHKVIDIGQVRRVVRDWNDTIAILDAETGAEDAVPTREVSIYRHRLIIEGTPHRILHMLSR